MKLIICLLIILSGCVVVDVSIENERIIKQKNACINAGMDYEIATNNGERQAYCTKKETL